MFSLPVSGEKLLSMAEESESDRRALGGERDTPSPASAMVGKEGAVMAEGGGTRGEGRELATDAAGAG